MQLLLKVKEWCVRYAIAEFIGLIASVLFAYSAQLFHAPALVVGYLGMMGDNVGFYGVILFKDGYKHFKKLRTIFELRNFGNFVSFKNEGFSYPLFYKTLRNIVVEFGPAEYLDSFVFRPAFLSFFPLWIDSFALAIVLGNLAANVTFYIPVIISYELRKKWLR